MENESIIGLTSLRLFKFIFFISSEITTLEIMILKADKNALSITLFFLKSKSYGSIISTFSTL